MDKPLRSSTAPVKDLLKSSAEQLIHLSTPTKRSTSSSGSGLSPSLSLRNITSNAPIYQTSRRNSRISLQASTSSQSVAGLHSPSLAAGANAYTASKFDNRNLAAAIERAEHRGDKLEARPGDVGLVGAVGFGGGDEWQNVCVRVLPLFNGEDVKGYIEDLNDLVRRHIKRIADRSPTRCVLYLSQHLEELLAMGMLTLFDKLQEIEDNLLLEVFNDLWSFFYSTTLPYLEAIFLPMTMDPALTAAATRTAAQANQLPPMLPIDVRRTALMTFRDQLIIPNIEVLAPLIARDAATASRRSSLVLTPSMSHQSLPIEAQSAPPQLGERDSSVEKDPFRASATSLTSTDARSTRMQMISILAAVASGDIQQEGVELLNRCLHGAFSIGDLERKESIKSTSTYKAPHYRPTQTFSLSVDEDSPDWELESPTWDRSLSQMQNRSPQRN